MVRNYPFNSKYTARGAVSIKLMSLTGASKIFETDAVPFLYSTQKLSDVIIHLHTVDTGSIIP